MSSLGALCVFKSSALGRHERDLPLKTNWAVWMNNSEVSLWTFQISHIIPTKNNSLVVSKVSCDRIISKKSTAWLPGIYKEEKSYEFSKTARVQPIRPEINANNVLPLAEGRVP